MDNQHNFDAHDGIAYGQNFAQGFPEDFDMGQPFEYDPSLTDPAMASNMGTPYNQPGLQAPAGFLHDNHLQPYQVTTPYPEHAPQGYSYGGMAAPAQHGFAQPPNIHRTQSVGGFASMPPNGYQNIIATSTPESHYMAAAPTMGTVAQGRPSHVATSGPTSSGTPISIVASVRYPDPQLHMDQFDQASLTEIDAHYGNPHMQQQLSHHSLQSPSATGSPAGVAQIRGQQRQTPLSAPKPQPATMRTVTPVPVPQIPGQAARVYEQQQAAASVRTATNRAPAAAGSVTKAPGTSSARAAKGKPTTTAAGAVVGSPPDLQAQAAPSPEWVQLHNLGFSVAPTTRPDELEHKTGSTRHWINDHAPLPPDRPRMVGPDGQPLPLQMVVDTARSMAAASGDEQAIARETDALRQQLISVHRYSEEDASYGAGSARRRAEDALRDLSIPEDPDVQRALELVARVKGEATSVAVKRFGDFVVERLSEIKADTKQAGTLELTHDGDALAAAKANIATKRDALRRIFDAVATRGDEHIRAHLGGNQKFVASVAVDLRSFVSRKDFNSEYPKSILRLMAEFVTLSPDLLQKLKWKDVQSRYREHGDDQAKQLIEEIAVNAKDHAEKLKKRVEGVEADSPAPADSKEPTKEVAKATTKEVTKTAPKKAANGATKAKDEGPGSAKRSRDDDSDSTGARSSKKPALDLSSRAAAIAAKATAAAKAAAASSDSGPSGVMKSTIVVGGSSGSTRVKAASKAPVRPKAPEPTTVAVAKSVGSPEPSTVSKSKPTESAVAPKTKAAEMTTALKKKIIAPGATMAATKADATESSQAAAAKVKAVLATKASAETASEPSLTVLPPTAAEPGPTATPRVMQKPGGALLPGKSRPVAKPVPKKAEPAPAPVTSQLGIGALLDSIQNPKPAAPVVQKEEEPMVETEAEKAKRLRKEARKSLRVTWRPDHELTAVREFVTEKERRSTPDIADGGIDGESSEDQRRQYHARVTADSRGEGMNLKRHVDEDEDGDEAPRTDEQLLQSNTYGPLQEPDLSTLPAEARDKNFVTRGGKVQFRTPDMEAMEARERRELMVVYTDPGDIPPSARSPPPSNGGGGSGGADDDDSGDGFEPRPEPAQMPVAAPNAAEVRRRWDEKSQLSADHMIKQAIQRVGVGAEDQDGPASGGKQATAILDNIKSMSVQGRGVDVATAASAHVGTNQTVTPGGHRYQYDDPQAELARLLKWQEGIAAWKDPDGGFDIKRARTARRRDYPDAEFQRIADCVEDVCERLSDQPVPAQEPPEWMRHSSKDSSMWLEGFNRDRAERDRKRRREEDRVEQERRRAWEEYARLQQDQQSLYAAQQQQQSAGFHAYSAQVGYPAETPAAPAQGESDTNSKIAQVLQQMMGGQQQQQQQQQQQPAQGQQQHAESAAAVAYAQYWQQYAAQAQQQPQYEAQQHAVVPPPPPPPPLPAQLQGLNPASVTPEALMALLAASHQQQASTPQQSDQVHALLLQLQAQSTNQQAQQGAAVPAATGYGQQAPLPPQSHAFSQAASASGGDRDGGWDATTRHGGRGGGNGNNPRDAAARDRDGGDRDRGDPRGRAGRGDRDADRDGARAALKHHRTKDFRPIKESLIGTKPCIFHMEGKCAKGDSCTFRHDI